MYSGPGTKETRDQGDPGVCQFPKGLKQGAAVAAAVVAVIFGEMHTAQFYLTKMEVHKHVAVSRYV